VITKEQAVGTDNKEFHSSLWHNKDGTCERWRRNGNTKTWKTRVSEFLIPVKHGMRDFSYITDENAGEFHLASECENNS